MRSCDLPGCAGEAFVVQFGRRRWWGGRRVSRACYRHRTIIMCGRTLVGRHRGAMA